MILRPQRKIIFHLSHQSPKDLNNFFLRHLQKVLELHENLVYWDEPVACPPSLVVCLAFVKLKKARDTKQGDHWIVSRWLQGALRALEPMLALFITLLSGPEFQKFVHSFQLCLSRRAVKFSSNYIQGIWILVSVSGSLLEPKVCGLFLMWKME